MEILEITELQECFKKHGLNIDLINNKSCTSDIFNYVSNMASMKLIASYTRALSIIHDFLIDLNDAESLHHKSIIQQLPRQFKPLIEDINHIINEQQRKK